MPLYVFTKAESPYSPGLGVTDFVVGQKVVPEEVIADPEIIDYFKRIGSLKPVEGEPAAEPAVAAVSLADMAVDQDVEAVSGLIEPIPGEERQEDAEPAGPAIIEAEAAVSLETKVDPAPARFKAPAKPKPAAAR